jgi:uncharacterized protein YkwD
VANRLIAADVSSARGSLSKSGPESSAPSATVGTAERQAFDRINAERSLKGLPALVWNDRIAAVARYHSQNMLKNKFFSHQDQDGLMVNDRADRMGLADWTSIGENIAFVKGFRDPIDLAIEKWMQSSAHRDNLLASRWKESAVGVAIGDDGTYYFTQVFIVRNQ